MKKKVVEEESVKRKSVSREKGMGQKKRVEKKKVGDNIAVSNIKKPPTNNSKIPKKPSTTIPKTQ
jgi:hypothetical protein